MWLSLRLFLCRLALRETPLVEAVAQALYHSDGGLTDEEYEAATGKKRRVWIWAGAPAEEVLAEHERAEYRIMAKAVLRALRGE